MYVLVGILILIILIQGGIVWKYQRQVKDICRQLAFIRENESNQMITSELNLGGLGELAQVLDGYVAAGRKERKEYLEKEQMLADMYTSLSHDIRTPLTSLDGYFQLLRETSDANEQARYLEIIRERIGSLEEMLEELFTFTKLKNESFHLELSECCLNRSLKESIFSYYEDWTAKGIEPEIQITEEPLYIRGNAPGLRRLMQNIIKNSMDHGRDRIAITLRKEGTCAYLEVENPVEHPEEIDASQVFERFYKADKARSRSSTGLGLAIAREFTVQMGGEIEAELKGEIFCIRIRFPVIDFPAQRC